MRKNTIDVSVIVPVYNAYMYIHRCLYSILNQNLESIELILVDDGSTDGSYEILKSFQQKYPEKVKVYRNPKKGAAEARNYGITKALGKYITFVDSDDFIEYDGISRMYEVALENDSDMVCAPLYQVQNYACKIIGKCGSNETTQDILMKNVTSNLYNKLLSRELISKVDLLIPDFILGEDTAYIYVLLSWSSNPTYLDYPYYYYEINGTSISNDNIDRPWIVDNVKQVYEWTVEHCNIKYIETIKLLLAKRFLHIYNHNLNYRDQLADYLKANSDIYLYGINYSTENDVKRRISQLINMTKEFIPTVVYTDCEEENSEFILNLKENSFSQEATIIKCNWSQSFIESKQILIDARENNDVEFIKCYYAIKEIYTNGGIYIHSDLRLIDKLNKFRQHYAFFGLESGNKITVKIFGGKKENSLFALILNYLDNAKYQPDLISIVVKYVLENHYRFKLANKTIGDKNGIFVYNSGTFIIPIESIKSYSVIKYCDVMNISQQQKLFNQHISELIDANQKLEGANNYLRRELEKKEKTVNCYSHEIKEIRSSTTFRVGRLIMWIPCKIKRGIQCISDHGLIYTARLAYVKVKSKLYYGGRKRGR